MSTARNSLVPRALAVAAALAAPVGAFVLYRFPPTDNSPYPRCLFHSLTGLHCPGCGATRCLHALLHGDLVQAAADNLLFLCLLPVLVVGGVSVWWALLRDRPVPSWRVPPWLLYAFFGIVLAFWVLRNLPFAPFTFLAPHPVSAG